jgi:Icc protein
VLEHVAAAEWQADLAAVTGDLIQDDTREAYTRFRNLMTPLGLPVYCVPGNHDVRELMRAALTGLPFHYCASIELGNWLIAGIDSCVNDRAGGSVAEAELQRLAGLLADSAAEHALICLHHPPLPVGSAWLDQVGLENGAAFLDLIAQPGIVRAAIFGHVHQDFEALHESIKIIATPSTCRQFSVGSDKFALDDRPPAYRRINLHADGRVLHELVWLGQDEH